MSSETPEKKIPTREKILTAAEELFVAQGFYGTSMSDIAKLAKVNQSLIHHHFDTKEKLWDTVRESIFDEYLQALEGAGGVANQDGDYQERLSRLLSYRFFFLNEHPEVERMLQWQNVHSFQDKSFLQKFASERSSERIKSLMAAAIGEVQQAQERGELKKNFKPIFLLMTAMTLTSGWFQGNAQWLLQSMEDSPLDNEELAGEYLDFVKDLIFSGVGSP